jgi:hypothetical protein
LYNSYQCSGVLNLKVLDPNNLSLRRTLKADAGKP